MKQTQLIMGMPITIEIVDSGADISQHFADTFTYFETVDARYSTYKHDSEISKINRGLEKELWSTEMKLVLALCDQTKMETNGYFDIMHDGKRDPSGLVKGWAIHRAATKLHRKKVSNFYIEVGGDIQASGVGPDTLPWKVGIRNPFNTHEIIKTIAVTSEGTATSGTYIRGQHIYNPFQPDKPIRNVKSITVIGPNIYEADRFATAAFAMGTAGIEFIEARSGLEGYMVSDNGMATYTSGFMRYAVNA
jgi:thiamine biosynthesis lipoprotein